MNAVNVKFPDFRDKKMQAGLIVDNNLPLQEGETHYNINIYADSLVGRFLSPYSKTPFSPDGGVSKYACAEAYFVYKRYSNILPKDKRFELDQIKDLHGSAIINARKDLAKKYRFDPNNDPLNNVHGDSVKEVLKDLLVHKYYRLLLETISSGKNCDDITEKPFLCYLTRKHSDGSFTNTSIFHQLYWMPEILNKVRESDNLYLFDNPDVVKDSYYIKRFKEVANDLMFDVV